MDGLSVINVIASGKSIEEDSFRAVTRQVLWDLRSKGLEPLDAGIELRFDPCVLSNINLVGLKLPPIENPKQRKIFDAVVECLEGPELQRKVVYLN